MIMQVRAVLGTVENLFMTADQFRGVVQCFDALHDLIRLIKYKPAWTLNDLESLQTEISR